jgi:CBS domain-containing protein
MARRKLIPDVIKKQELVFLSPSVPVREAVRVMVERQVAAVLVVEASRLVGIFTERDVTQRIVALNRDPDRTLLSEVMSANPDILPPDAEAVEALGLMEDRHIRHLPVVDHNGTVWGIVSIRDLFGVVREALQEEIHEREEFIHGTGAYSVNSPH